MREACRLGEWARIGAERPEHKTAANRIRPEVLRFFILGGDDTAPVHEQGVQLAGAWIDGGLDLDRCRTMVPVDVCRCRIDGAVSAYQGRLAMLSLRGTAVSGLVADGLECDGGVFLSEGFHASGKVRLPGVQIGANLECDGGRFDNAGGYALSCDGMTTGGGVYFRENFHAGGEVLLLGAKIGGSLVCDGGRFDNGGGRALHCERITTRGSVFLRDGFQASGEVRLLGAKIGGSLECDGGRFENPRKKALDADRATVVGGLFFRSVAAMAGTVDLTACQVGQLVDDAESWGKCDGYVLDHFRYGRLVGKQHTDAPMRIAWLKEQAYEHAGSDFRPQPWEHLVKVLREMGHDGEARKVAIAKQDQLRRWGRVAAVARPLHWLYGLLAGYGYRPLKAVAWIFGTWIIFGTIYHCAAAQGWFAPTSPLIHKDPVIVEACAKEEGSSRFNWTTCTKVPPAYTTFSGFAYSLDLVLPLVDLQQESDWAPMVVQSDGHTPLTAGIWVRRFMWFEILFGWGMSLLLVAVLGNLVKKD